MWPISPVDVLRRRQLYRQVALLRRRLRLRRWHWRVPLPRYCSDQLLLVLFCLFYFQGVTTFYSALHIVIISFYFYCYWPCADDCLLITSFKLCLCALPYWSTRAQLLFVPSNHGTATSQPKASFQNNLSIFFVFSSSSSLRLRLFSDAWWLQRPHNAAQCNVAGIVNASSSSGTACTCKVIRYISISSLRHFFFLNITTSKWCSHTLKQNITRDGAIHWNYNDDE